MGVSPSASNILGGVTQLLRVSALQAESRGFKSLFPHQLKGCDNMVYLEDDIITKPLDPNEKVTSMYGRIPQIEWLQKEQNRIQSGTKKQVGLIMNPESGLYFLTYVRDKDGKLIGA